MEKKKLQLDVVLVLTVVDVHVDCFAEIQVESVQLRAQDPDGYVASCSTSVKTEKKGV